jgi:hypothetical protein
MQLLQDRQYPLTIIALHFNTATKIPAEFRIISKKLFQRMMKERAKFYKYVDGLIS